MEQQVVEVEGTDLRTGTRLLSQGLGVEHRAIKKLVVKYKADFEELGPVEIFISTSGSKRGRHWEEYMLNFGQIALAVSLLTNSRRNVSLTKGIIKKNDIVSVLKALSSFDNDNIDVKFVYATVDSQGRVKIGISNNPERRIKELNIGNADDLTLIYSKRAGLPKHQSETTLHKECSRFRIRGEWFAQEVKEVLA